MIESTMTNPTRGALLSLLARCSARSVLTDALNIGEIPCNNGGTRRDRPTYSVDTLLRAARHAGYEHGGFRIDGSEVVVYSKTGEPWEAVFKIENERVVDCAFYESAGAPARKPCVPGGCWCFQRCCLAFRGLPLYEGVIFGGLKS